MQSRERIAPGRSHSRRQLSPGSAVDRARVLRVLVPARRTADSPGEQNLWFSVIATNMREQWSHHRVPKPRVNPRRTDARASPLAARAELLISVTRKESERTSRTFLQHDESPRFPQRPQSGGVRNKAGWVNASARLKNRIPKPFRPTFPHCEFAAPCGRDEVERQDHGQAPRDGHVLSERRRMGLDLFVVRTTRSREGVLGAGPASAEPRISNT